MATRDTTSLPVSNDFKSATNAEMALHILGQILQRIGRWAEMTALQEVPEAFNEALLTQTRNQLSEVLTELDAWRAL